ncbi:MAG: leucine-rich repeat protein [Bacteroidales bacterium]|nr:leucine-rich repeat protein [Candidatus Colimorpha merdihippi]
MPSQHCWVYRRDYITNIRLSVLFPQTSGALVIPSIVSYNGTTYPVTSIGYSAFLNCSGLTSVTVPSSVTYIDVAAFANCNSLTSITSYSVFPPDLGKTILRGWIRISR